ncbi:metal-dependent hydrolase [Halorarius halobius]|uniref:metal-dependent hydrolase n=1 Tax=Halorarius halobius TaxID=2962671 RepID=UPI0020CFCC5E|nr:metal-dependent hydrolase [Halorarius halobius]
MWPWAHAALGYLCYTLYLRGRGRGQPSGWPVVALGVGTQLPDLVDKPLAWYLHVLPYGRTLAHSLLVAAPLVALVWWLAARRNQRATGTAFAVGYLAHLLGDALYGLVTFQWADLGFLLWPLVDPPESEVEGVIAHLSDILESPFVLFGFALTAAMLLLWNHHGRPGLAELGTAVRRRVVPSG